MTTTYSPEQLAAAHRLHDTCHELLAVTADEPARIGDRDFDQRYQEWHDLYGKAYRVHEDAEHDYRHAFGHSPDLPEAHEVIAAERHSMVELLQAHVIETVTQVREDFGFVDNQVTIDCKCGAVIEGEMPDHIESTSGSLQWLMADHIARVVLAARR